MCSSGVICAYLLLLLAPASLRGATFVVAQLDSQATDSGPGTSERPWKTVAHAAEKVGPGDVVEVRDGVYRERVVIKTGGTAQQLIRLQAAPGAYVILTGADLLKDWHKLLGDNPVYSVPWPHRFVTWSKQMTHPDDAYHRLIGRCEQVVINNSLLRQVLEAQQLAPGTFFADTSNQVLHVWDAASRDLNKLEVEGSTRQEILRVEGNYVEVRGFHFRFAANMAQHGAVVLAGAHDLLEDCTIENMSASGASFTAPDQVVRRCIFRDNGQLGFGANGAHRLLFTECVVENNNVKGFDRGWEAGGDKLVLSRDVVLERSQFVRNRGNGIWFDIGNEHPTVRQCLIADNEDSGIFYEISFGLQAHDNVITGNGFVSTPGARGAQAGISISSSPDCVIERNLLVANREGFDFREQARTTPRIGRQGEVPVWNHDERIEHNIIAFNRDAQVWGWFDMKDNRHWPAGADSSADTQPASSTKQYGASSPGHLSLAQLHLRFERNIYFAAPGQGCFHWGVPWARHNSYPDLHAFQAELGIDTGSTVVDPAFSNIAVHDFRLPGDGLEKLDGSYPQAPVPGVRLGEQTAP